MTENSGPRPGFFAELRRRRVLRTLALYIVAAWVLMQVADVVFPALDIPEQAIRYLLLAAVVGFPVALVFGWFFDITPNGIQRTGRADAADATRDSSLRLPDYLLLAALAAVLGAVVYGTVGTVVDLPNEVASTLAEERAPRGDEPPMVAVLPFSYRGLGEDAEFFAGGVHDDLLTQLSQLSGLRVVSRTSVLAYAGTEKKIPEIGRELGADVILEGGVQLAGGQIRINAQLIDARSDEHLWAETFDRELSPSNLFAVQSEIARQIAQALDATLSPLESDALAVIPTASLPAYRAFHTAQNVIYNDLRPDLEEGIRLLDEALELDPQFTKAMVQQAYALSLSNFGGRDEVKARRVEQLIERIGAIAPDSIDYLIARAYYIYYVVRDYDAADRLLEQARQRAPSNTDLVHIQSWIKKRKGDFDGWIALTYELVRLDPAEKRGVSLLVYRLSAAHRYEEALQVGAEEPDPNAKMASRVSRLELLQHHDLQRHRGELLQLVTSSADEWDVTLSEDLVISELALRDYPAALSALERIPDRSYKSEELPLDRIPIKLEWRIMVGYLIGDEEVLASTLAQTRRLLGLDDADEAAAAKRFAELFFGDRYRIALAAGDTEQARKALDEMGQVIDDDIAPMIVLRAMHCRGLALLEDVHDAVSCLRAGIDRPSEVMPFFEPLLPFYDRVRDSAQFQQLLASLRSKGWLE